MVREREVRCAELPGEGSGHRPWRLMLSSVRQATAHNKLARENTQNSLCVETFLALSPHLELITYLTCCIDACYTHEAQ